MPIDPRKDMPNPVTAVRMDDGTFIFHGRSLHPTRDKNRALEPYGCVLLQYGLQLQLLPTPEQAELIRRINGCARIVGRDYLSKRQEAYRSSKETLTPASYKKEGLKALKEEFPFLKEADKFALEAAVENIDTAYRNFFSGRARFPKFPSKYTPSGNRYTTKYTNGNISVSPQGAFPCVRLPKVGAIRFIRPAGKPPGSLVPPGARITKATVIKDGKNYLVSLQMEQVVQKQAPVTEYLPRDIVALDVGIREFAVYGSGSGERVHVPNEKYIALHEKRLRRFQKALSRKKYDRKTHTGSKNYYKAKEKVAREQRKTANQRKDMQHKLSRKIAGSCRVFVCEDLNIKGMMKNRRLAKAIAGTAWGQFLGMVRYKVERGGGIFLKVSRWYPSSKTCACCGHKNENLSLKDRFWICPGCGRLVNRDENAVDNLIREGCRILGEKGIQPAKAA